MVQMVVDDPSWGNILGGFSDAFDPARQMRARLLGAQYAHTQLQNEKQRAIIEAIPDMLSSSTSLYDQRFPPGIVPTPAGSPVPFEGPATPEQERARVAERNRLMATQKAAAYSSSNPKEFVQSGYGVPAVGEIASGGIPTDKGRRDVLETMIGSMGMSMPGYDQAKMPIKQYEVVDPSGNRVSAGFTQNGVTDVNGNPISVPPGHVPRLVNPVAGDINQYKAGEEIKNLAAIDAELRANGGQFVGPEGLLKAQKARILFDQAFPVTVKDGILVREKPIPQSLEALATAVERLNGHQGAPAVQHTIAPVADGPFPSPDATAGGLAGVPTRPPVTAPGTGAPQSPAPIVPGLQPSLTGSPVGGRVGPGDPMDIVTRFHENPVIKTYNSAIGPYNSLLNNIQVNSPQADVAVIYAVAKILDPGSVVREGEMVIWNKTSSLTQQLDGYLSKALSGEASLTPEVRKGLLDAANQAVRGQYQAAAPVAESFRNVARDKLLDPDRYIPFQQPGQLDPSKISSRVPQGPGDVVPVPGVIPRSAGGGGATATPQQAPQQAAPQQGGGRTIRVNPQTGEIEVVQ